MGTLMLTENFQRNCKSCSFQVADDPETLRIRQNTKNISNAAYHGEYLKKEKMERQRELADVVENKDLHESEYFSEQLAAENISDYRPAKKYDHYEDEPPQQAPPQVMQHQQQRREPMKKSPIEELRPMNVPAQAHSNNMQHQSIPASNNHTQQYRQAEMPINKNSNANNMRELAYQQQKQHHQQQLLMQQQQQLLYQRELAQQQQQMLDSRNLSKSAQYQRSDGTNNYMSNSIDHSMNHRNNCKIMNLIKSVTCDVIQLVASPIYYLISFSHAQYNPKMIIMPKCYNRNTCINSNYSNNNNSNSSKLIIKQITAFISSNKLQNNSRRRSSSKLAKW